MSWKYTESRTRDMWPRESTGIQFRCVGIESAKLRHKWKQNLAWNVKNNKNKLYM